MHRALDLRVAAVMPALVDWAPAQDEAMLRARAEAAAPLQKIVDAAHRDGALRPDVAFGDVGLLLVRLSRPLPGPFPPDLETRLARRHLDLLLDGLRCVPGRPVDPLPGPAITLEDLRAMFPVPAEGQAPRPRAELAPSE